MPCESVTYDSCEWCGTVLMKFERVVGIYKQLDEVLDLQKRNRLNLTYFREVGGEKALIRYFKRAQISGYVPEEDD